VTIQPRFDIVTILFSPDVRGCTERHGPRGIGIDCSCLLSLFELTAVAHVIIRGHGLYMLT
jgi:hypothetical protein